MIGVNQKTNMISLIENDFESGRQLISVINGSGYKPISESPLPKNLIASLINSEANIITSISQNGKSGNFIFSVNGTELKLIRDIVLPFDVYPYATDPGENLIDINPKTNEMYFGSV